MFWIGSSNHSTLGRYDLVVVINISYDEVDGDLYNMHDTTWAIFSTSKYRKDSKNIKIIDAKEKCFSITFRIKTHNWNY